MVNSGHPRSQKITSKRCQGTLGHFDSPIITLDMWPCQAFEEWVFVPGQGNQARVCHNNIHNASHLCNTGALTSLTNLPRSNAHMISVKRKNKGILPSTTVVALRFCVTHLTGRDTLTNTSRHTMQVQLRPSDVQAEKHRGGKGGGTVII